MAKYKVKEYQHVFPYNEDDQYEFPRPEHMTFETEVEWDNKFCPTQIAAKGMWVKYRDELMDFDEWLDQFVMFNYGYCDFTNRHWLSTDLCDGDNVKFIAISIKEVNV